MRISNDQLNAMLANDDEMLVRAIQKQVSEEHAYVVDGLPQDIYDRMVTGGIRRARAVGLTRPSDLACFVLLMYEFGPEFWRHPYIEREFANASIIPHERLQRVVEDTPGEVWQNIVAALHRQRWFREDLSPESGVAEE